MAVVGSTVKDAARVLSVRPQTVRDWLAGKSTPSDLEAGLMPWHELGIDSQWLFGRRGLTQLFRVPPGKAQLYYSPLSEKKGGLGQ